MMCPRAAPRKCNQINFFRGMGLNLDSHFPYAVVKTTVRLRFDGRSTEVIKVTVTSPANGSHVDLFIYLAAVQQPGRGMP